MGYTKSRGEKASMTVEINWKKEKLDLVEKDVSFISKDGFLVKTGDIIYWGSDSNRLMCLTGVSTPLYNDNSYGVQGFGLDMTTGEKHDSSFGINMVTKATPKMAKAFWDLYYKETGEPETISFMIEHASEDKPRVKVTKIATGLDPDTTHSSMRELWENQDSRNNSNLKVYRAYDLDDWEKKTVKEQKEALVHHGFSLHSDIVQERLDADDVGYILESGEVFPTEELIKTVYFKKEYEHAVFKAKMKKLDKLVDKSEHIVKNIEN